MRSITAQELAWLEQFMREQGKDGLANPYQSEGEELQADEEEIEEIPQMKGTLEALDRLTQPINQ